MNTVKTVTSQSNPLAYLKAIATLVGTIVTGLLGVYTSDTPVGQVLTVIAIIATALATWVIPNAIVVPAVIVPADDDETYEEAGGHPYPDERDHGLGGPY